MERTKTPLKFRRTTKPKLKRTKPAKPKMVRKKTSKKMRRSLPSKMPRILPEGSKVVYWFAGDKKRGFVLEITNLGYTISSIEGWSKGNTYPVRHSHIEKLLHLPKT